MIKSVDIKVFGRVQGVGFRYYTEKKANELGIKGFVKNMTDGSVYIEADAEEEKLKLFVLWCEEGPTWARVDRIEKQFTNSRGYNSFMVK